MKQPFITLRNGVEMPLVGLGTFKSEGLDAYHATLAAIQNGYLLIDTAKIYGNEDQVGRAIKDSGVDRAKLFITTKVWTTDFGVEKTQAAVDNSLTLLGLDYVDLVLLHWPKSDELNLAAWQGLEAVYFAKKARAIGVSNFLIHHLEHLWPHCKVYPMVNQFELHPLLQQRVLREWCVKNGVVVNSYGPLAKGNVFDVDALKEIAAKHQKSIVNIIVRWGLQQQIVMIPKSIQALRVKENFQVFDFTLDDDDMAKIRTCNRAKRVYSDPDNIEW